MTRVSLPILASMILASAFAAQGNADDKSVPTNWDGDPILVTKFTDDVRDPEKWDVTVFSLQHPSVGTRNYIRRLIGLPGETLVLQDGQPHVARNVIETIKTQDATIEIIGRTIRIDGGHVEIRRAISRE